MKYNLLKTLIMIAIFAGFSCNVKRNVDIPDGVIPKEDMAEILRDIHLTDALIARQKFHINKDYKTINGFYKEIYEKHGYDREIFDSSLAFYTRHPFVLDEIYDQVLTDLSKMKDTISVNN